MWTNENRARYDRSHLRYPSDLTDDEWKLVEPLIPPGKRGGDKRTDHARDRERPHVYSLHRLSVASHPERPATALDVVRLFRLVELGSHARSHTS